MRKSIHAVSLASVGLVLLTTTSCGVIFGGTRQTILVESSPDAATIKTSPSTATYTTPSSLSLERRNNYTLTFEKEGYASADYEVQRKLRAGILVLDILTGLVGVAVDAATGGWYKLEPRTVTVSLQRITDREGPETIDVELTLEDDASGPTVRIEPSEPGVTIRIEAH